MYTNARDGKTLGSSGDILLTYHVQCSDASSLGHPLDELRGLFIRNGRVNLMASVQRGLRVMCMRIYYVLTKVISAVFGVSCWRFR